MSRYVKAPGTPTKGRVRRRPKAVATVPVLPDLRYHSEELADMRFDEREEIRSVLDRWRFD